MRGIACLLAAKIMILLATSALAQAQVWPQDTTPCREIAPEQVTVPDDFSLVFRDGGWRGATTITKVSASGYATIDIEEPRRSGIGGGRPEITKTTRRQLSEQAIRRVYASVLACRFFELNESYWNTKVLDGWSESLNVTAGGKKHNVNRHYYRVNRFESIVSALKQALEK
jgi:hypothetical protein